MRLKEVPPLPSDDEVAIEMLGRAGLLDAEPQFVSVDEFDALIARLLTLGYRQARLAID